jgi:hypothetical protein
MVGHEYTIKFFGFGSGSKGDSGFGRGGDGLGWRLASLAKAAAGGTATWRHKAGGGGGGALLQLEVGDEAGSWAAWAKRVAKTGGPRRCQFGLAGRPRPREGEASGLGRFVGK